MNREQAENILAAYVVAVQDGVWDDARDALREVILDAMTEVRYYPTITYPRISTTGDDKPFPNTTWRSNTKDAPYNV